MLKKIVMSKPITVKKKMLKRLNEINEFVESISFPEHYMKRVFTKYPDLMKFEIEKIPELITKGVRKSKLENIDANEIVILYSALDQFVFLLPFAITTNTTDVMGSSCSVKGDLAFNLTYHLNKELLFSAYYKPIGHSSRSIDLHDNWEDVLVKYVCEISNILNNTERVIANS